MTYIEAETRMSALPIESFCFVPEWTWRRSGTSEYVASLFVYEEGFSKPEWFKGPSLASVVEQAEAKFGTAVVPDEALSDEPVVLEKGTR